jgi:hypothetical protein
MWDKPIRMALKVAMLSAAGRAGGLSEPTLVVTRADAESTLIVIQRWHSQAVAFARKMGATRFEKCIERCTKVLAASRRMPRRTLARQLRLEKRMLDSIQETLVDRGLIRITPVGSSSGPSVNIWEWTGDVAS